MRLHRGLTDNQRFNSDEILVQENAKTSLSAEVSFQPAHLCRWSRNAQLASCLICLLIPLQRYMTRYCWVSPFLLYKSLDASRDPTSSLQARQYELQLQREHCAPQYDKPKVTTHETFTAGLADRASASALPSCVSSISAVLIVASLQKAFATVAALRTSCQSSRTFS